MEPEISGKNQETKIGAISNDLAYLCQPYTEQQFLPIASKLKSRRPWCSSLPVFHMYPNPLSSHSAFPFPLSELFLLLLFPDSPSQSASSNKIKQIIVILLLLFPHHPAKLLVC